MRLIVDDSQLPELEAFVQFLRALVSSTGEALAYQIGPSDGRCDISITQLKSAAKLLKSGKSEDSPKPESQRLRLRLTFKQHKDGCLEVTGSLPESMDSSAEGVSVWLRPETARGLLLGETVTRELTFTPSTSQKPTSTESTSSLSTKETWINTTDQEPRYSKAELLTLLRKSGVPLDTRVGATVVHFIKEL